MWIAIILAAWAVGFVLLLRFGNRLGIARIKRRYRVPVPGCIVFYGASNFTLWRELARNMLPHRAQNHGFGGSTDEELIQYANKILYPYAPKTVVFQSGSNDFAKGLSVGQVCANKEKMYTLFRERLPGATFIALAMLPLPGRIDYWPDSVAVNAFLRDYCQTHEGMMFVNATDDFTTATGNSRPELFRRDGIHLNRAGQLIWGKRIKQELDAQAKGGFI